MISYKDQLAASKYFQTNVSDLWMRKKLSTLSEQNQKKLRNMRKNGFFNLPEKVIDAFISEGWEYGGFWENERDYMHFEIKKKSQN